MENKLTVEGKEFLLNGKPFRFISGAIHYFRIPKESWYRSLYNLKAMGANTVETYIPWNLHEKEEGNFDFSNELDIKKFVKYAESLGLWVILRPSPYICAEWEFGGFPAWLLNYREMRIRSSDPQYLEKVSRYYEKLFEIIAPLQSTKGGAVLMMQLENEYGSYGNDKKYLEKLLEMMLVFGCDVPIVTSDGGWQAVQEAGNLIEQGILPTGNFGSKAQEKFLEIEKTFEQGFPLMCMEFWDGWFNRYGEKIVKRDALELAESVKEVLEVGSVNLYMFHGGTNYGFMNGCSSRAKTDLPQVTSYDYDAPLDEAGNPTEKYYALQTMIHELFPQIEQKAPIIQKAMPIDWVCTGKVSLFEVKDQVSKVITSDYPMTMEELNHPYGYVLYEQDYLKCSEEEVFRVIDASDRVQFFLNGEHRATQYQEEIGKEISVPIVKQKNKISLLLENLGRVTYGARLFAESQRKGIRTGVMSDLHFMSGNWKHYCLLDEQLDQIDFSKEWQENIPAFYQFEVTLEEVEDTYLDMSQFGKGFVSVNGKNIGRFWERGPFLSLYVSKAFLKKGINKIIIFESEGRYSEVLRGVEHPVYLDEEYLMDTIKK